MRTTHTEMMRTTEGTHMKALIASMIAVAACVNIAHANAQPDEDAYEREMTIKLSQIADEIDGIPACVMEDGSDVIPAIAGRCLWSNDGNVWLTYEDRSFLIVDDTAVGPFAYDDGAYVGGYN